MQQEAPEGHSHPAPGRWPVLLSQETPGRAQARNDTKKEQFSSCPGRTRKSEEASESKDDVSWPTDTNIPPQVILKQKDTKQDGRETGEQKTLRDPRRRPETGAPGPGSFVKSGV